MFIVIDTVRQIKQLELPLTMNALRHVSNSLVFLELGYM